MPINKEDFRGVAVGCIPFSYLYCMLTQVRPKMLFLYISFQIIMKIREKKRKSCTFFK